MNNIEFQSLNIKVKKKATISISSVLLENKYTGNLDGYYIKNSNWYNVLSTVDSADQNRLMSIGYIFPFNPFEILGEKVLKRISFNTNSNSDTININTLSNTIFNQKLPENLENLIDTNDESLEALMKSFDAKYALSINNNLDDVIALEKTTNANFWFKKIIERCSHNCSIEKEIENLNLVEYNSIITNNCPQRIIESHNTVIGYWENNKLHFIQLNNLDECKIDVFSIKLDVFSRNTGILESDVMLTKGAIFIGCGSVGSLFALELARAGVGKFMLVDNDILGYHNICRHQCGIFDVGKYKTDAVKERILQINPYARVETMNMTIQDVPLDELLGFCDKNTIVIGGADNREGDLYANGIAQQVGMPFMSIGCWERAFAGEIFYCLPEGMPTYLDFMEVSGHMSARVSQNRRFYTTEEELEKVSFEPGISVDINFVTTIAVKLALDILNLDNSNYTQRLLPHLTQYTLICNTNNTKIGGDMAEVFSYPLQVTTSIVVPYSKKNNNGSRI